MNLSKVSILSHRHWFYFVLALGMIAVVYLFYVVNIVRWIERPDFGWRPLYDSGPNVVAQVFKLGEDAGFKVGDKILEINGETYGTFEELFKTRKEEIGAPNTYKISRDGRVFEVTIINQRLGFKSVLYRSGFFFVNGLTYVLIGIFVFLMKPKAIESRLFFTMTSILGVRMSYFGPSDLMDPIWLYDLRLLLSLLLPASMIHLALRFPKKRTFSQNIPWILVIPYLASVVLFVFIERSAPTTWNLPPHLNRITMIYTLFGAFVFLFSMAWNFLKESSILARLQSKVIFLGLMLAIFIPASELIIRSIWPEYHFPGPEMVFFISLILFPLSIGYSIVKHNLFDIDAIIKRTYGYILTTGSIAGIYGLIVLISNLAFRRFEITKSPLFPLVFVLAVVFFFNPIRNRVQKFIDRVFYRLEYDYQETLQKVSEAMRSLLNLDQIKKKIVDLTSGVMFIDSVCVMILDPKTKMLDCLAVSYASPLSTFKLPADDPLFQKVGERKKEVTLYDIQEDPFYEQEKEASQKMFERLEATLVLPLIYENRLIGLISLGRKKSGKYYRREDINLLKTLANQGAVAIENARLADQMKSEEAVRANLARYLSPQIVDQIIKKDVQVNLGGDRKVVTVLFSDIRNFTRITETLKPDQLVALLNEYFTEMAGVIFESRGSLDKYIGDAIVAVFGSLISLENPSRTAVQAATHMMKRLSNLRERWRNRYGVEMEMGIGINTGEVFLGNIGSPERMEFTVIGDTVNIASRFSGIALGGQILITKETLSNLGPDMRYQELPPVEVKGKTGRLEVYEIVY